MGFGAGWMESLAMLPARRPLWESVCPFFQQSLAIEAITSKRPLGAQDAAWGCSDTLSRSGQSLPNRMNWSQRGKADWKLRKPGHDDQQLVNAEQSQTV